MENYNKSFFNGFSHQDFKDRYRNAKVKGKNIDINIYIDLKDTLQDCKKNIIFHTDIECDHCNGSGEKDNTIKTLCDCCNGNGFLIKTFQKGNTSFTVNDICNKCNGNGNIILQENKCQVCNGIGKIDKTSSIDIVIPSGMFCGTLRVQNQGYLGKNGGDRGDLLVKININESEYKIVPNSVDLLKNVKISFVQACLGSTVNIDLLDGSKTDIEIPNECIDGYTVVIPNQGLSFFRNVKRKGNLIIYFYIDVPKTISEYQRCILNEFYNIEKEKHVKQKN